MVGRVVCWVMPLPMMTWMTLAFILAIHSLHYKWWSSLFEILSHILDCCYRLVYPWTLDFQCGTWQRVVFRSCHIFLWHAPLGVHSAKRRHQSSEWTILSQVNCIIFRDRLFYFRTCWIVFIHVVRGRPGGLLQFSKGELLRFSWHLFHHSVVKQEAHCLYVSNCTSMCVMWDGQPNGCHNLELLYLESCRWYRWSVCNSQSSCVCSC